MPRLLIAQPQSLFDRSSGAAVSMRHLGCLLASQGWAVQAVCTSASEDGRRAVPRPDEDLAGMRVQQILLPEGTGRDWARHDGGRFEAAVMLALATSQPDLLLTFGADALEHRLCTAARAQGTRVLLALHNLAYRDLGLDLPPADGLLLPSQFMARAYAGVPLPVVVLPPPLWPADVQVTAHDPVFATFVNPEPEKGARLVARLTAMRPDWPLLVVQGRAGAGRFAAAVRAVGGEPAALPQVHEVPGGVPVRELLAVTRVLLMPSCVAEAAGRLAAEAVANGIPALVSARGGLPEMVEGCGTVIEGDPDDPATVARWAHALDRLQDDAGWAAAAARTRQASARWQAPVQAQAADAALRRWLSALAGPARPGPAPASAAAVPSLAPPTP